MTCFCHLKSIWYIWHTFLSLWSLYCIGSMFHLAQVCSFACLCESPVSFIEMQAAAVSCSWYYLFMSWACFSPDCLDPLLLKRLKGCVHTAADKLISKPDVYTWPSQSDTGHILNNEIGLIRCQIPSAVLQTN